MNIVLNIIGNIRTRIFVSSTCVNVQRFHDPVLFLPIAALSKNLLFHKRKKQISTYVSLSTVVFRLTYLNISINISTRRFKYVSLYFYNLN